MADKSGKTTEQLTQELQRLKKALATAKENRARQEGQLEKAMNDLKALGCSTIAEAEKKVAHLDEEAAECREQVANGLAQLREEYGW